jgi:hypothetical protein
MMKDKRTELSYWAELTMGQKKKAQSYLGPTMKVELKMALSCSVPMMKAP